LETTNRFGHSFGLVGSCRVGS